MFKVFVGGFLSKFDASDMIAIVAIIVSAFVSIYAFRKNNDTTRIVTNKTFNNKYFDEMLLKFLFYDMPEIQELLKYENLIKKEKFANKFNYIERLIMEVYKKISPFEFLDESFYKKFRTLLKQLEDQVYHMKNLCRKGNLKEKGSADKHMMIMAEIKSIYKEIYLCAKTMYEV